MEYGNRVLTAPGAVRIFRGYRRPELSVEQFRTELGSTFMPGTPYLLAPLGLHAYAGAILDDHPSGTPHETGLIAYPSRGTYQALRNGQLRGRLYTQTHGGVYDQTLDASGSRRSTAQWAEPLDGPAQAGTVHLMPDAVDLQQGSLTVHVGVPADPASAGQSFTSAVRAGLPALRDRLRDTGHDQGFVLMQDGYFVAWLHGAQPAPPSGDAFEGWLGSSVTRTARLECRRVVCLGEPPTVSLSETAAVSFVFARHENAQLR